ncbi:MAG: 1-acyl-sn-glycerol-3-phosphate acyltransferase [Chloroflexota bacterium]
MQRVTANLEIHRAPHQPRWLAWFGRLYFWLTGWKIEGIVPDTPRMVIIAFPHTSNWDGWNLVVTSWIVRADLRWVVKEEFMRWPFRWFIRATGGLPIKRDGSQNVVDQAARMLRDSEHMLLLISPEGTRKKTDHWKTGFYWIAHKAEVPMLAARMDYGTKTISFTGPFEATGDIEADIQPIWDAYRDIKALHPEKMGEMVLRTKDKNRAVLSGRRSTTEKPNRVSEQEATPKS